ncbi:MAG: glycosyltransferase [Solirubrobacterales bacterium]
MSSLRLAVYTDDEYSDYGGGIYARRAFTLFLGRLAERIDRMIVVGRLREGGELAHYRLSERIEFVGLPYYESLASPLRAGRGMGRSIGRFWRSLEDVDACWLLGPHPFSLVFAAIAVLRRRRVILGVRQDLPEYARSRHPGRPGLALVARLLEGCYRLLARRFPTVVVGPALRRRYRRSPRLLEIAVSLVDSEQVVDPGQALTRPYDGELRILSVGRIDEEKNPLMLAEALARLCSDDPRWRLTVCGEGLLEDELRSRLAELGVADRAELRGYVDHEAIRDLYLTSHLLLHVSRTEGLPQVIIEALAAGLPVVATDVGGIREAVGDAAILVPSGDVAAAVDAARRVAADAALRRRMIEAGVAYARIHTLDAEVERVESLLSA